MTHFSKLIVFTLVVFLLAWILPWSYYFITSRPQSYPFTLYSCITHSFASVDYQKEKLHYGDSRGNTFTEAQFDSILPTFYYHRLVSGGRFPQEIEGVAITLADIKRENFIFRHSPADVNTTRPALYPLLETMPKRAELEMPDDVFRLHQRMEFIEMATNTIREDKSELFTQMLKKKNFHFPARFIAGNPTTRKEYDEGYFITDQNKRLFHLKQLCGRPYVKNIGISETIRPRYIFPTEYPGRRTYCLLTDTAHHLYALKRPDYQLYKLPLPSFNPEKENLIIIGDAFYWTIQVSGEEGRKLYAVNARDYTLADTLSFAAPQAKASHIAGSLFPFQLSFTSYDDHWVYPRFSNWSARAFLLHVILAIAYWLIRRKRDYSLIGPTILICFLGIFGLLPLLLFEK